ncbi:hypothetical protein ACQ4PT_035642 [Festuca glaucescens]
MEGRSGAPRAAAAALVRNTGVAEPDVAVAGRGRRRGSAASGGLVVGETSSGSSVRKRKFAELDDFDDSSHSYISSDIESGDAVSYNPASSDASSEAEVTKYNELSYEKRVTRDGLREGLVAHAKTVKPKDRRDKANHAALIKVNMDAHIAQVDAPRNAQKRITIRGPGIVGNEDFDSFCVFPNLVEMDDEQLGRVKRVVRKHKPSKPLYVFTIKKSNIIKGKAKMYLYWEKCPPQEGDCAFNPRLSIRPLMRNWNEASATRRDNFDYENGHGRGNVKIEENITKEYRMQEPVVPDPVPARQEKAKPRTLELFNKQGVTYKPADTAVSGNMEDEEDVDSFQNGPREKKEFMYKKDSDSEGGGEHVCSIVDMTLPDEGEEHGTHVKEPVENGTALPNRNGLNGHTDANDSMRTPAKATGVNGRTPDKPFGDLGSTPDNPFIIDNVDPVTLDSDIDIDAVSVSKFLSKAKKDAPNGCPPSETRKEDELVGKRKRTVPKKIQSPYALDRPMKRQVRGSSAKVLDFDDKPAPDENSKSDPSSDLTPELVDAAIVFLELASRSEQHKKKNVYRNSIGDEVNAERLRVVLNHKWS